MSLDATGILMQGDGAAKADGRMVYVGMIYNPQPRAADEEALSKPCDGARYLAGLYALEELGLQMRRQGAQVGMDAAERWIALTDGGQRAGGRSSTLISRGRRRSWTSSTGRRTWRHSPSISARTRRRGCWRRGVTRSNTRAGR